MGAPGWMLLTSECAVIAAVLDCTHIRWAYEIPGFWLEGYFGHGHCVGWPNIQGGSSGFFFLVAKAGGFLVEVTRLFFYSFDISPFLFA